MQELARRHPHSRSRGRRGTPGEVAHAGAQAHQGLELRGDRT
jgi:hypothetical protein